EETAPDGRERPVVGPRNGRTVGRGHSEFPRQAAVRRVVVMPSLGVFPDVGPLADRDPVLPAACVADDLTFRLFLVRDRLRWGGVGQAQAGDDGEESRSGSTCAAKHGLLLRSAVSEVRRLRARRPGARAPWPVAARTWAAGVRGQSIGIS